MLMVLSSSQVTGSIFDVVTERHGEVIHRLNSLWKKDLGIGKAKKQGITKELRTKN